MTLLIMQQEASLWDLPQQEEIRHGIGVSALDLGILGSLAVKGVFGTPCQSVPIVLSRLEFCNNRWKAD